MATAHLTILGGGIAGLGAAYHARRRGLPCTLYEAADRPGGNCITLSHGGFRFDSGAHRLHGKAPAVTGEIGRLLGDGLAPLARPSLFLDGGRFVDYPVSLPNLLRVLGPAAVARAAGEIACSRLRPARHRSSYEEYAVDRYGRSMAERFLLPFTRKIWGIPCGRLAPEIADKRFREFGIGTIVRQLAGHAPPHRAAAYFYPEGGIGAIADALAAGCGPGSLRTKAPVTTVEHDGGRIVRVRAGGESADADLVVSTIPVDLLVRALAPPPPAEIAGAAARLRHRTVLLAAFFLDRPSVTGAATIYVADPSFAVTRIYEPRNRDERMAPPGRTSLVAEIPCDTGDGLWSLPDAGIVDRARTDLVGAGLLREGEILGTACHRMPHAYPVMDLDLLGDARAVLDYLGGFRNLRLLGRCATYRYLWMHEILEEAERLIEGCGRGGAAAPVNR